MDLGADMFLADTENLQIKKVKEIAINAAAGAPQEEEKDVTILYPAGGEVIYHGQPFIIEVKVNKSGNYVLSFTNMIYTCEFYGAEGSVYILPLDYGSYYHNDNKLQIHEKSSGTLIAESEEFTIGATPPFNAVTNAVPGDSQVSLSWQPMDRSCLLLSYIHLWRATLPEVGRPGNQEAPARHDDADFIGNLDCLFV